MVTSRRKAPGNQFYNTTHKQRHPLFLCGGTPTSFTTVAVAGLLLTRTSLDVVMLNLTTTIERAVVARNKGDFRRGLSRFARLCVPVAVINSVRDYHTTTIILYTLSLVGPSAARPTSSRKLVPFIFIHSDS